MTPGRRLEGKVAFVTGGSTGIGAAIVRRLASEGARVAFTYIGSHAAAERVANAVNAFAMPVDSVDVNALAGAIVQTVGDLGRLDILVNNAGVSVIAPIDELKLEDIDRMLAVNVRAVIVATQAAARVMKSGGRIITIGSCNSDRVPFPGASVYALTKAALRGFVKGAARDLGERGITINNVEPGPTETEANSATGPTSDLLKGEVALGRYATPDEIAALVSYVVSDEARYVTGATFTIDGGFTA